MSYTILVVEDAPESLKATAKLLRTEGYDVHLASNAEQALVALETIRPDLMLVDLQLPGMSGLELIRRIKDDTRLNEIAVVVLTACAAEEARQSAREAGCDEYLTKPIEPRTLIEHVRESLKQHCSAGPAKGGISPAEPEDELIPNSEMEELRRDFVTDGTVQSLRMLASLESQFDAPAAGRLAHQWVGSAGLLGYPGISGLARVVENILRMPSWSPRQLRVSLTNLACAFADPGSAAAVDGLPSFISSQLARKKFAAIGFELQKAEHLSAALERAGASVQFFSAEDAPDCAAVDGCCAVIVHVCPETLGIEWLSPEFPLPTRPALLLAGERQFLLSLNAAVLSRAHEFLIDDWQAEEALMRLGVALSRMPKIVAAPTVRRPSPRAVA